MKLQLGRRLHTTFHAGRIQSCCYLAPKKKIIYNELIWHFMTFTWVFLGVTYRHKLNHSLLGFPRKMVLLKFENIKRDEWYWWKLLQIRLLWFFFTIPHKVVCNHFAYFLGTANLRNNSLLVRTISIVCAIPCQRPEKW